MEFLNEYMLPVVSGICLCVGYVVKQWITDIDNKYIPTISAVLGIIISAWLSGWEITPDIVLSGMISGLGSVGMHQLFKQYLDNKSDRKAG